MLVMLERARSSVAFIQHVESCTVHTAVYRCCVHVCALYICVVKCMHKCVRTTLVQVGVQHVMGIAHIQLVHACM